jgi:hypothetical protein
MLASRFWPCEAACCLFAIGALFAILCLFGNFGLGLGFLLLYWRNIFWKIINCWDFGLDFGWELGDEVMIMG